MHVHTKPLSVGSNSSHIPTDSSWLEWSRLEDFSFGISKNKMYQLFGNHQNWEWINQRSIIDHWLYSSWYVHVCRREVRRAYTYMYNYTTRTEMFTTWVACRQILIQKEIIYRNMKTFVLSCLYHLYYNYCYYLCVCVCVCVSLYTNVQHAHIHVWAQGDKPRW